MLLFFVIFIVGILNDKIGNILSSLVNLLRDCDDSDLLEHVLSQPLGRSKETTCYCGHTQGGIGGEAVQLITNGPQGIKIMIVVY